jgi:diguanylate cyclase (GGDEF)-like protein
VLDTITLRIAFSLIALCVLVLFYVGTYCSTRSAFSGWWVLSLLCYLLSAVLFLLNGTPVQVVANPAGNLVAIVGSACVYAAASSLRQWQPPLVGLLAPAVLVFVLSLLDDPAHDVWAGGPFFLAAMWGYYVLGTRELWLVWRSRSQSVSAGHAYDVAVLSMTACSALVGSFYFVRWCLFLTVGPDSDLFAQIGGAQITTLLLMILLVVVTFNMSALSQSQLTHELRVAATHDALTGLLNRGAFEARAEEFVRRSRHQPEPGFVVMADFDDFKLLNDHYGHASGDDALVAFGVACRAELRDGEVAARLGGDEFVLLLPPGGHRSPEETVSAIGRRLAAGARRGDHPLPTVSFGIAEVDFAAGLEVSLARADAALYRAKGSGFGNAVRAE